MQKTERTLDVENIIKRTLKAKNICEHNNGPEDSINPIEI